MMRVFILGGALSLVVAGCAAMDTSGVVEADPEPFPHPGIYSGSAINGIVTYKINADGRGLSCFRNKMSGKEFFGDLKYDGERIYTEDGTLSVKTVSKDSLELSAAMSNFDLRRVEEAPTICKDFFSKD